MEVLRVLLCIGRDGAEKGVRNNGMKGEDSLIYDSEVLYELIATICFPAVERVTQG